MTGKVVDRHRNLLDVYFACFKVNNNPVFFSCRFKLFSAEALLICPLHLQPLREHVEIRGIP